MGNEPAAQPRKKPRQRRAQETVAANVEATARVLRAARLQGASTNKIAKIAGVSVGFVHPDFPNKQALVVALAHQHATISWPGSLRCLATT